MIALLGGLGAALAWGVGTLCSARSSRIIGAWSVVAWVMLFGLVANLVVIAVGPMPASLGAAGVVWMLVSGLGNAVGLLLEYTALRRGKVGIVTPVASTEGAIAAVLAVVAGEALGTASAVLLAVVALGIVLAGVAPDDPLDGPALEERRSGAFGWPRLPRCASVSASSRPATSARRSPSAGRPAAAPRRRGRRDHPGGAVAAAHAHPVGAPTCGDDRDPRGAGFRLLRRRRADSVAVAAVLGSQFAAVAAVAAYVFLRERLGRLQLAGVAVILVGVAALTWVTVS